MGATKTLTVASQVELPDQFDDIRGSAKIDDASIAKASELLQENHEKWHMFFRDLAGHNHIAHSILTCLALGATPEDIQRAYDDGEGLQRPIPECDANLVESLSDDETMCKMLGTRSAYATFLAFFQRHMEEHGWKRTVIYYVFSRSKIAEKMLARLYEGAYHPVIHLGLGIEFQQPSIVAEALAQAAAHDDSHIETLFQACEAQNGIMYPPKVPKSLVQLLHEVRTNETIRNAPRWEDFYNKMRDGVVGRACIEFASVACQFWIKPEDLERRTAEMINTCAYMAGACQRPGRKRKIDFFYMHAVTSSIFFSVIIKQDWIKLEDRVRMVEWKSRLDLAWYVVCGCAEPYPDAVTDYHDDFSATMDWDEVYAIVNKEHDDGHVAKMIRALKNGEEVSKPFESGDFSEYFPVKGDMWIKIARMVLDTTKDVPSDKKFIQFIGTDMGWKIRPDLA